MGNLPLTGLVFCFLKGKRQFLRGATSKLLPGTSKMLHAFFLPPFTRRAPVLRLESRSKIPRRRIPRLVSNFCYGQLAFHEQLTGFFQTDLLDKVVGTIPKQCFGFSEQLYPRETKLFAHTLYSQVLIGVMGFDKAGEFPQKLLVEVADSNR